MAVYDKDHQTSKTPDGVASANKSSANIEAAIDQGTGASIVLVNDIEEEVGIVSGEKSKPYVALTHIASPGFKTSDGLSAKVKSMYQ